jgi:deferrochelatase/peroxidase EfeB
MSARDETGDIQALIKGGFGSLGGARFILLQIADRGPALEWLRSIAVTSVRDAERGKLAEVVQLAFTARGLRALGWAERDLEAFAPEFLDGLAGDERRSHRLGDSGANAPATWLWGYGAREPDVFVLLLAQRDRLDARASRIEDDARASGLVVLESQASCPSRSDGGPAVEPFGFADGLSQPEIDWDGTVAVHGAANRTYRNRVAAGEFLLGHTNEYGFVADYPQAPPLGRNGSYLVYRQLEQDVVGLWRWLATHAGSPERAVALAERMVGRRRDGSALPGLAAASERDFLFDGDPEGIRCPIASHIRRANPRSGDDPNGRRGFLRDLVSSLGFTGTADRDAVASVRFHRLLRRGRPYGAMIDPLQAMGLETMPEPTGLHFLCLNASLARQFEFVQDAWIASPAFGGRAGEQDPLLGNRRPLVDESAPDCFRYVDEQGEPRLCSGMPQFVTVRGGAYFFLPGLRGLQTILGR